MSCSYQELKYPSLIILASETKTASDSTETLSAPDEEQIVAKSEPAVAAKPVQASVQVIEPAVKDANNIEAPEVKANNETIAQNPAPPAENDKNAVVEDPIKEDVAVPKPLAPADKGAADAKKPETTKSASKKVEVPKSDDEQKVEIDQGNQENPENADDVNIFDDTEASEMPEKDNEIKNDGMPYDDDDEYGGEDAMARNNNKVADAVNNDKKEAEKFVEKEDVPQTKIVPDEFVEDPDSNFFTYLCILMFLCLFLYILHQNRQKILALFLEGRRGGRRSRERSRGGSKAAYSKLGELDSNLEEAIMSKKSLNGKSMDIIYWATNWCDL